MVFKLGTEYHFDKDAWPTCSTARASGSAARTRARRGHRRSAARVRAGHLKNYELGLKSQWLDNTLQLNVAAFLMKWDDIQLNSNGSTPWWVRGNFNGGKAEQKGVELNGT